MIKLSFVAATTLAILCATSAQAQVRRLVMVSTSITYEAQDLAGAAGAKKMLGRIGRSAQHLCTSDSPADAQTTRHVLACRRAAVSRAVEDLAAPLVTAAYERSGARSSMTVAKR